MAFSSGDIIKYGIGSGLLVVAITWFINNMGSAKDKFLKNFFNKQQEQTKESISDIEYKQNELIKNLDVIDKASNDAKLKIKNKLEVTSNEIKEILKQDSISQIDDQVKSDWDKI